MFPERVVLRFGTSLGPEQSPHMSTSNILLWVYLKSCVYSHKPQKWNGLREVIREVAEIDVQINDDQCWDDVGFSAKAVKLQSGG